MSILFCWLQRGGRWGSSPSTSPADHQKLNVIQKWAFHFFGWRGVANGVWVHRPAWLIIRSWTYSKNKNFIYLAGEGWQMGFKSIDQPCQSSEVECNPKRAFHFFGWRGVADGVWVPWPAWLIIRSWKSSKNEHFIFLAGERWQMGFESINQPGWSSEVECIPKMSISFIGWRRVADGVRVCWPAQPNTRSWT